MAMAVPPQSRFLSRLAWLSVLWAIGLVWWGAAVTTKHFGMAVPGWPLSFGKVNPEGWIQQAPLFYEHGHRLAATGLGLLVATLTGMLWWREKRPLWKYFVLLLAFATTVGLFSYAHNHPDKQSYYVLASLVAGAILLWFFRQAFSARFSLEYRAALAALMGVVFQAIMGGLRVQEISDAWGIFHGSFGQVYFCWLIFLALLLTPGWRKRERFLIEPLADASRTFGVALIFVVLMQLIFGATIRHFHRVGLAANDILTTGGTVVPAMENRDLFQLFLHKSWALVVFATVLYVAVWTMRQPRLPGVLRRLPMLLLVQVLAQVTLGVLLLWTGHGTHKNFWITNFHVLNGLGILAASALFTCHAFAYRPVRGMMAASSPLPA